MSKQSRLAEIERFSNPGQPAEVGIFIFAGHGIADNIGGLPKFEFVKTMEKSFPSLDVHFYVDYKQCWYSRGLEGITSNVDETIKYLDKKKHKKNIFMGNSAGAYASILFGSILEVDKVIAFHPQTNLNAIPSAKNRHQHVSDEYMEIEKYLNDTTEYKIYGCNEGGVDSPNDPLHNSAQIDFLMKSNKPNLHRVPLNVTLKQVRDRGDLIKILEESFKL